MYTKTEVALIYFVWPQLYGQFLSYLCCVRIWFTLLI